MPVASAPLMGAALGLGVQLYVNAVRKLPLMRSPYLHVLWAGAGASFGAWLVDFEDRTEKDLAGESVAGLDRPWFGTGRVGRLVDRQRCGDKDRRTWGDRDCWCQ